MKKKKQYKRYFYNSAGRNGLQVRVYPILASNFAVHSAGYSFGGKSNREKEDRKPDSRFWGWGYGVNFQQHKYNTARTYSEQV